MVALSQFAWTFPGGKHKQEVTSLTLANNTAKTNDIVVPTGKIWILLGIKITNPDDVGRNIVIRLYKEAAKTNLLRTFQTATAMSASGEYQWPSGTISVISHCRPNIPCELLSAGNTLSIIWDTGGASAGGTDADGQVLDYLEIDAP